MPTNRIGKPANVLTILIPSTPPVSVNTSDAAPMRTPQNTLRGTGASSSTPDLPPVNLTLMLATVEIIELASVINEMAIIRIMNALIIIEPGIPSKAVKVITSMPSALYCA